jgi:hypothetical protein
VSGVKIDDMVDWSWVMCIKIFVRQCTLLLQVLVRELNKIMLR